MSIMSKEFEKQGKPTSDAALILLSLEGLLRGTPFELSLLFPQEEDYRQLADELEENPPPDLTPEGLSMVLQILRGEGNEAKFIL